MTKKEWVEKLRRELQLRKYATSTIDTYCGNLGTILNDYKNYNGYQSIEDIKSLIENALLNGCKELHKELAA